ncbi:hypothetical protein P808_05039 [Klebsiella pneumoniae BIDMC 47]|nr:hypothetical protein P808_05039 [Klebsiella pneumoniae BIDMC 47]
MPVLNIFKPFFKTCDPKDNTEPIQVKSQIIAQVTTTDRHTQVKQHFKKITVGQLNAR